ncbi:MAG: DUF933 domain-containing protein, partial [Patescibacteria group bacterium]
AVSKLKADLKSGKSAREVILSEAEQVAAKSLGLLTAKPILISLNTDEDKLKDAALYEERFATDLGVGKSQVVAICAKTEMELASLNGDEQEEYLRDLGVEESGLERLIQRAFTTLGLLTFLTAGEKEVRAWTIHKDMAAQAAAGVIHSDFATKFIKADVVPYSTFVEVGGWKKAREEGKVRSEGKNYQVQDGDVVEFKIGA